MRDLHYSTQRARVRGGWLVSLVSVTAVVGAGWLLDMSRIAQGFDFAVGQVSEATGYAAYRREQQEITRLEQARRAEEQRKRVEEERRQAELRAREEEQARRRAAAEEAERKRLAILAEENRREQQEQERKRQEAEAERRAEEQKRRERAEQAEAEEEEKRRNPAIIFRIKNNHRNKVLIRFQSSSDSTRIWPSNGEVYYIADSQIHTYRIDCYQGEKICYGAWVSGSALNDYWGTGYNNKNSCTGCCYTCPAWNPSLIELDASDAKTPAPSMTWRFQNRTSYRVSFELYSDARRGHVWPGNNKEWVLGTGGVKEFSIGCRAGEKICYGAWYTGNPSGGYWGVGNGNRNACSNCCRTCDGTEKDVITFDP